MFGIRSGAPARAPFAFEAERKDHGLPFPKADSTSTFRLWALGCSIKLQAIAKVGITLRSILLPRRRWHTFSFRHFSRGHLALDIASYLLAAEVSERMIAVEGQARADRSWQKKRPRRLRGNHDLPPGLIAGFWVGRQFSLGLAARPTFPPTRRNYASQPDHSDLRRELYSRKAALIAEGDALLKSAGPHNELPIAKLTRLEAVTAELDDVGAQLARDRFRCVRQLAGRLAGEIIFVPGEQATALLASGQVILPWERSTIQGRSRSAAPRWARRPCSPRRSCGRLERTSGAGRCR